MFQKLFLAAICHYQVAQGMCCEQICAVQVRAGSMVADNAIEVCAKRYGCAYQTQSVDDFCGCWRYR